MRLGWGALAGFPCADPVSNRARPLDSRREATSEVLVDHGDFGIGTFDGIDGELVVANRCRYQVSSNGRARIFGARIPIPWAAVTELRPTTRLPIRMLLEMVTSKPRLTASRDAITAVALSV